MSTTHPLWRPYELVTPEELARAKVGDATPWPVQVVAPDPGWPAAYEQVRAGLVTALGDRALAVAHVGSTSVRGLWAKPIIDIDLTVADSADEHAWLPDLEAAGFVLHFREPEWEEHRLLKHHEPKANVHVFSPGAIEPLRHLAFTSWLSEHPGDLAMYADLKRQLAAQGPGEPGDYTNAKAALVYDLYERIFAADPAHLHDPQPRMMQDGPAS